jgi:hypothetical protein
MQIKYLGIKVPINTKVPQPNFYRNITRIDPSSKKIEFYAKECFYWLDDFVFSDKQIQWLGDIKSKILKLIPEAVFVEYSTDSNYIDLSDKFFTLKTLQQTWTRTITDSKKSFIRKISKEESIVLPKLIPMPLSGKHEYKLYTVLTQYATRLHYEKLFQFEYLYVASKIYNKNSEDKLLPRKLLKLTHKAFNYINQEILSNPDNFKQKLNPNDLRKLRIKHGLSVLQKSNNTQRKTNTSKIKEAIATDKYYKADGTTLNVSAIANTLNLSRPTITAILKTL